MNKAENKSARIFYNLLGYLVAVGAVALATWLKFLAQPKIIPTDVPILYLVAIVPTAIFFGLGPSLLVCFLSFLAYDYYFLPPIHQITFNIDAGPILAIFLIVGVLFSYLASNLRKQNQVSRKEIVARKQSEAELMKHREHLDELVKQRTSELEKANLELNEEISGHKKAREALTRSEQRWATTLASIGDGVMATDVSGRVTFMNVVAEDLTGWKMAEAIDKPVAEVFKIVNEITRQRADNPVDKVLQQGVICSLANHTVLIKQDGTEISIDDSGAPIKNSEGITTGVVLVFRDITERRKVEKVLRQMEKRNKLLADILEHASQPFGIGLPDGRLGIVNKAFCDLTGYTEEELKTMDWAKVLTPTEYNTMETEKLAELVKTGQPIRYQKEYIRKDNSRVPIELLVHLVRGEDGEAEYYYSFLTDITERKKSEERLKQSEEKYRTLVNNIPDEVWFADTNKNSTLVNPDVLNEMDNGVAGIAAEALANRLEVYRPDGSLRPMEEAPPLRALKGEYVKNQEEIVKTSVKGELRYRQVSAAPVKDANGNIIGSVAVLRDVTDQRKAEEALKESEKRYRELFENISEGFALCEMIYDDNGKPMDYRFININPMLEKFFGLSRAQILGKTVRTIIPNVQPKAIENFGNVISTGKPLYFENYSRDLKKWFDVYTYKSGPGKFAYLLIDITERKRAEEEKQITLNRFYSVLSEMPLGILLVTEDGLVEFANQAFCDIFNIKESPIDLRNRTSREIIEKIQTAYMNPEKSVARIMEILTKGKAVKGEEVPMRGGQTVLRDFIPVPLAENKYSRLWIHRDITERKNAELALQESEAKANALIKYAPTAIYEIDYRGPRFLNINDATTAMTGYSKEELFAMGPGSFLDDDSKKLFADRVRRQLAGEKISDSVEFKVKKKDGSIMYTTLNIAFSRDNPNIAFVIGHDVTERVEAANRLKESEEKFSKAFHSSPVGLVITHLPDGRWVDANDTYLKMLEYTREEVMGHTSSDLKLYPDADKRDQIFRILREEGKIRNIELRLRSKTGRIIETLSSVEKIILLGEEYSLSTNVDITARKEAEEELRKRTVELTASNKELEAFSYSVSHDLRAPLRSIAGFSNVLIEDYADKLDEEAKQYLRKIEASSELMGQLMDDLLKLSRVTRSELNSGRINLSDMAHKIVDEFRKDEPNRKVKVTIAPNMTANGDKNLLSLVLQNLLGNAWKYSSKTSEPRIEMGTVEYHGKQAYFVRDNGVGFDMAYANKLFQPFQRLHKASEFAGIGIGLATVQRIIHRHGGEVWAESKVGQGATFYFTLS